MHIFTNRLFFIYIICSATLAQILSDLYLPSLPYIQKDLITTTNFIQFSVTLFMFGFSWTQLFYGALSNAFGRKYTFLTSLIIANFGSFIIIYSCNITTLFIGRLLQGIGAAGCVVTSRAMIRDIYPEYLLARMISYITIARGIIFIIIPILGGYIQNIFGWKIHFLVLFAYTLIIILIQIFFVKETNLHSHKKNIKPKVMLHNFYQLFSHKMFIACGIASMLAYGGLSAWLTVGPFIVQDIYGYNSVEFGYIAAAIGLYFAVGGFINSRIVTMKNAPNIIKMGFACTLFSGLLLLISLWIIKTFLLIFVAVGFFFFAASIIIPNAAALCMQPFKHIAGLAASVVGCLQIAGGVITSSIISYAPDYDQLPLAIIFVFISFIGIIVAYFINKYHKNTL